MFTHACFVKVPWKFIKGKYLPDREQIYDFLIEIGYKPLRKIKNLKEESAYGVFCNKGKFRFCSMNDKPSKLETNFIDCEDNVDFFKSIAALRDDSDYAQWFTDEETWEKVYDENPSKYMMMNGRKVTAEEIIEQYTKPKDFVIGNDPYNGIGISRGKTQYKMFARDKGIEITVNGKLVCSINNKGIVDVY